MEGSSTCLNGYFRVFYKIVLVASGTDTHMHICTCTQAHTCACVAI